MSSGNPIEEHLQSAVHNIFGNPELSIESAMAMIKGNNAESIEEIQELGKMYQNMRFIRYDEDVQKAILPQYIQDLEEYTETLKTTGSNSVELFETIAAIGKVLPPKLNFVPKRLMKSELDDEPEREVKKRKIETQFE